MAAPSGIAPFDTAHVLTWRGRRIGDARETLRATGGGFELVRAERIAIRRGDRVAHLRTRIAIDLDPQLVPLRVSVTSETNGNAVRGHAVRTHSGGWRARYAGADVPDLAPAAVPLELVPLLIARQGTGRYEGPVLLAGYGFATGELYARPIDDASRRVRLSLVVPSGVLTHDIELADDGTLAAVIAPGSVESRQVDPPAVDRAFEPPELVDAASIPVAGARRGGNIVNLIVEGVTAPAPPVLPAQALRHDGTRWDVTLAPGFNTADVDVDASASPPVDDELRRLADGIVAESRARTPMAELRALALYTDRLIANDLSAPPPDARSAFALGRGDCTTHAQLFAAFAAARGFDVRLVTGYRLTRDDAGHRLVRHRWALARVEDRWIAIDPTYGEAPAAAVNLGLAVHGASTHELAIVDELAFAGFANATARFR